ncbi:MAG: YkvA family protein [Actinomycetota bacterium]
MKPLLIGLGVAAGVWLIAIAALAIFGRRSAARELAGFLPNLALLFKGLLRDQRVPRRSKFWLLFAVVWIASPIDLIPEFIPVAGPLDDAIVAALVLRHLLRKSGASVVREHWRGDPATLDRLLGAGHI